jgi:hypothetical protein
MELKHGSKGQGDAELEIDLEKLVLIRAVEAGVCVFGSSRR